jgi:hypothetical protein
MVSQSRTDTRQLSIFDVIARRSALYRERPDPLAEYHLPDAGEALVAWVPGSRPAHYRGEWRWPGATDSDWREYVALWAARAPSVQVVRAYRDGVCVWDTRDGGAL